jgi:formate hydrogenlyase transcriptional activator
LVVIDPPSLSARYESLFRISHAISANRDIDRLFEALRIELHGVVKFGMIALVLFGESGELTRPPMVWLSNQPVPEDLPHLETEDMMAGWVHRNRSALVVPDVDEETRFPNSTVLLRSWRMRSAVAVPLRTVYRRLGTIFFASEGVDVYSEDEVRFLSLVADGVAMALDDALNTDASQEARAALEREKHRLHVLLDLTTSAVSTLELPEVARAIANSVRRPLLCDAVAVALRSPVTRDLRIVAVDSEGPPLDVSKESPITDASPFGTVYRTGKPWIRARRDPTAAAEDPFLADLESVCILPLEGRERVLGILCAGRRTAGAFSPDDLALLLQVAGQTTIAVENALAFGEIHDLKEKLAQEKLYLEDEIQSATNFAEIIGESPLLRQALDLLLTVAPTDSTVLLLGETGTGKELFARAIHNRSPRKHRTFVKLNCAAIPTGLLESEIFGHERGAFTGAISQKIGRFELADHGTLFLDEIGDIPLELQPKLLRALQEREFERLGSTTTRRSDARLVAATNRNLEKMVKERAFRKDLFYRLNVFPIRIPALRDRPGDVPLLVRHFTKWHSQRMNKAIKLIPAESMKKMSGSDWPGNVRELENLIERAVILSKGSALNVPLEGLRDALPSSAPGESSGHDRLLRVLKETRGRVSGPRGAAERLGLKRTTLSARLKKLGINPRQFS